MDGNEPNDYDDYHSPDRRPRRFSARELITTWLTIGDQWEQPNPEFRDEPNLKWREREFARDLEASAAAGIFTEQDKIRLQTAFAEGGRQAAEPEVAKKIQAIIESFDE